VTEKATQIVTPKQNRALIKLLAGGTDAQAAKAAGVNRRTVFEWRHDDPVFATEYRSRQEAIFDRAMRGLMKDVDKAARTVSTLTDARDESVRLRAAESIIDRVASFLGGVPGGKERMAQALGVQINVGGTASIDIDLTGERIAAMQRVIRECKLIDVSPLSVQEIKPSGSNGTGKA